MASEVLSVPEDNLREVIKVIREGLKVAKRISKEPRERLVEWCDEEEEYLNRI